MLVDLTKSEIRGTCFHFNGTFCLRLSSEEQLYLSSFHNNSTSSMSLLSRYLPPSSHNEDMHYYSETSQTKSGIFVSGSYAIFILKICFNACLFEVIHAIDRKSKGKCVPNFQSHRHLNSHNKTKEERLLWTNSILENCIYK